MIWKDLILIEVKMKISDPNKTSTLLEPFEIYTYTWKYNQGMYVKLAQSLATSHEIVQCNPNTIGQ